MSAAAKKWVSRQIIPDNTLFQVLDALAWRANGEGICWAAQATLAEDKRLPERTVRYAMAALERLGLIGRTPRWKKGGGRTTDVVVLHLSRDFEFSKSEIRTAKQGRKEPAIPAIAADMLDGGIPAIAADHTGNSCRGYTSDKHISLAGDYLSNGREDTYTGATCDAGAGLPEPVQPLPASQPSHDDRPAVAARPRLTVIAGGGYLAAKEGW